MTAGQLHEAIALLRIELRRFDETITGLERYALGPPKARPTAKDAAGCP